MAQGGGMSPTGAEQLLIKVLSTPQSTEAPFMSTEWVYMQSRTAGRTHLFQDLLRVVEREQSLLIGQTHAGPLLKTLSVSLAMSLAFSVSAL